MGLRYYLYSPNTVFADQMFQQGLLPNQGVGKGNEGSTDPIIASRRPPRAGWNLRRYFGRELAVINAPYTMHQIDWLFQNSDSWAIVFV